LSDSVQQLSGDEWTQSARKGKGDIVVKVRSSGNSTVRGGYVRGDYPSTWTWSYLKTEAHYNGAAFAVSRATGDLTFDGQYTDNVAVDAFRIGAAPASLTIKNNYSFNNRDDFVAYPAEDGTIHTLNLRDNFVHTFTWLSWRNTGGNDRSMGRFRLEMAGNLVHLKPQAGTGTCRSVERDGKVAGRPFKMDSGFRGSRDLFDVHDNIFWIEEGPRDGCSHVWPTATYRNNVIYYSGRAHRQSKYLGEIPAGIRVLTGAAGKAAWDERVAQWLRQHHARSSALDAGASIPGG
jgi:hypothetical protein